MLVACADLRRGAKLAVGANAVADARAAARITGRIMLSVETRKQQFHEVGKNNQNASTELPRQHRNSSHQTSHLPRRCFTAKRSGKNES